MSRGNLQKFTYVAGRNHCGTTFWRAVQAAFEQSGRPYLSFEKWDELFEIAREDGIMEVVRDEQGNAYPQFISPLAFMLLKQWRAVKDARERGITARQLAEEQMERVNASHEATMKSTLDYDRTRTAVAHEKDGKYSRRSMRRAGEEVA